MSAQPKPIRPPAQRAPEATDHIMEGDRLCSSGGGGSLTVYGIDRGGSLTVYGIDRRMCELDTVELWVDLPDAPMEHPEAGDAPLHVGDRGVVVLAPDGSRTVTVEFFRDGETVAIVDVERTQLCVVGRSVSDGR